MAQGYRPIYLGSGTEALALAVRLAIARQGSTGRVLLPAYGCPDLVAAVVFAGATPVLLDTAPGKPFLDPEPVAREIERTGAAAIVVTHFLGLRDDMAPWREISRRAGVSLIEDSAQLCPWFDRNAPQGDFVVASFGRGKPLNAGGGGMLLMREPSPGVAEFSWPASADRQAGVWERVSHRLRCALYNRAIGPRPYSLAAKIPGLAIGATRYVPLQRLTPLSQFSARVLAATSVAARCVRGEAQATYEAVFSDLPAGWINLPSQVAPINAVPPLLRYPLLAPSAEVRDRVVTGMSRLGVSAFYGRCLADLVRLPEVECSASDEARDFAGRLLTLPLHSAVGRPLASRIAAAVAGAW